MNAESKHSRRRRLVWRVLAVLGALVVSAGILGWLRFRARAQRRYTFEVAAAAELASAADVARGEHLARTLGGCAECHGSDFGGKVMGEDAMMRLVAPNLTSGRGSAVRGYEADDWARAIVHGTRPEGTSLLVMPSADLASLADDDVAAISRYMQALPPVDRALEGSRVSLLGKVVLGLVDAPVFSAEGYEHERRRPRAPTVAATRAYGDYLANICRGCHGADLKGGIEPHPGAPISSDISQIAMKQWRFSELERALRTGVGRDGRTLDPAMPWGAMKDLSNDELRALWLALRGE